MNEIDELSSDSCEWCVILSVTYWLTIKITSKLIYDNCTGCFGSAYASRKMLGHVVSLGHRNAAIKALMKVVTVVV